MNTNENSPTGGNRQDCEKGSLEYAEPVPTILPQNRAERALFFKTHDVHPERGEYFGDGIARTAGGYQFEPLSWKIGGAN